MKRVSSGKFKSMHNERGQGLVEFALITPLLLLLLLGTIDLGRTFFIYSEVSNAVREATRFGSVNPYDCEPIKQRAGAALNMIDIDALNLTISFDHGIADEPYFTFEPDCSSDPPKPARGDRVTISASAQVNLLTANIIGPVLQQTFGTLSIEYTSSRTVVPIEGIATGPTTTPYPTSTPPPGASPTFTDTPPPTATSTLQPPLIPPGFLASVNCNNGKVDFSWGDVPGATSYRIYQTDSFTAFSGTSSIQCNDCDDMGSSQQRSYYVVAVNDAGESEPSNISTIICGSGATDTPTATATATPTSTFTNTPVDTATPIPTATPRPTRTPAPTLTGSETATPDWSPTPTSVPALNIVFEPGYPSRIVTGPPSGREFWVKVRVSDPVNYPVIDATVTLVEPIDYAGTVLTHLGNGVYGLNGTCFSGSTNANTYVIVRAERFTYGAAEVGNWSDNNPSSDNCP